MQSKDEEYTVQKVSLIATVYTHMRVFCLGQVNWKILISDFCCSEILHLAYLLRDNYSTCRTLNFSVADMQQDSSIVDIDSPIFSSRKRRLKVTSDDDFDVWYDEFV